MSRISMYDRYIEPEEYAGMHTLLMALSTPLLELILEEATAEAYVDDKGHRVIASVLHERGTWEVSNDLSGFC